jgi:phosphonate transport system substrate-binding protein
MAFNRVVARVCQKAGMVFILLFFLSSCDTGQDFAGFDLDDKVNPNDVEKLSSRKKNQNAFIFGFDLRASPQEDARQYLPFLAYLEKATGYKFKLQFTPENLDIAEEVGKNKVQFAALGAVSFIKSNSKYGTIPLVRGINSKGKAEYQSVFVVSPKSKIKSLKDVKGKRLAFGSQSSTQGHLIPRIELNKNGIKLNAFSKYIYTGSHQNCATSITLNESDVCAMQDTMAKLMEQKELVKIIHTSNYFPSSGIVANKGVPDEVLTRVKQALLNFNPLGKDKEGLYHWNRTEMPLGFAEANLGDYRELKKWSFQLGFIKPAAGAGN